MQKLEVTADLFTPEDEEISGMEHIDCRVTFSLFDSTGKSYEFIVDLPSEENDNDSVDVWVKNSTVQVGDTPEDGFATFTPVA